MIRYSIISYYIILLLLPIPSAAAFYSPILEQVKPGTITIIGESHKRLESVELFQSLVLDVIRNYQCVVIGLEIASDQQEILDVVMQGRASVNDIALWPAIDYPSYRRMIANFAKFKRQGQCITLLAIDSGTVNVIDRDLWMALSLAEQSRHSDTPILVLLGALHALKRVDWKNTTGRASVAELLAARGFSVKSYPQRWFPDECAGNRIGSFVSDKSPQALAMLNDSLMSLINAKPHKSVSGVVDGFVVWQCDSLSRDDLPHSSR